MWRGIGFVGVIMAAGTLFVLDASLPGGFIAGSGDLRYGQTMAFTTLMLFQMFNVLNARSDRRSAFADLFTNHWLWTAIGGSLLLQVLVTYTPFLQRAFGTASLAARIAHTRLDPVPAFPPAPLLRHATLTLSSLALLAVATAAIATEIAQRRLDRDDALEALRAGT